MAKSKILELFGKRQAVETDYTKIEGFLSAMADAEEFYPRSDRLSSMIDDAERMDEGELNDEQLGYLSAAGSTTPYRRDRNDEKK